MIGRVASLSHLERTVGNELHAVCEGNGSAGRALASGVDDGLDGSVDLGERHLPDSNQQQRRPRYAILNIEAEDSEENRVQPTCTQQRKLMVHQKVASSAIN